jgi:hypothetical protein
MVYARLLLCGRRVQHGIEGKLLAMAVDVSAGGANEVVHCSHRRRGSWEHQPVVDDDSFQRWEAAKGSCNCSSNLKRFSDSCRAVQARDCLYIGGWARSLFGLKRSITRTLQACGMGE